MNGIIVPTLNTCGQIVGLFAKFPALNRIIVHYLLLGEPNQNGISKHCNSILMGMLQSMLSNVSLPVILWMEALKITAHKSSFY